MLEYYGLKFFDRIQSYYRVRFVQAKERGFDAQENPYFWLYQELKTRLMILCQAAHFMEVLPHFMVGTSDEQAIQYAATYVSRLFRTELVGELKWDQDLGHPYFNANNPYWLQMNDVPGSMDDYYDTKNLPLLYIDLCEYIIRSVRLLFQIREHTISAIDREKFDVVMELNGVSS